jgi:hypothetical protein
MDASDFPPTGSIAACHSCLSSGLLLLPTTSSRKITSFAPKDSNNGVHEQFGNGHAGERRKSLRQQYEQRLKVFSDLLYLALLQGHNEVKAYIFLSFIIEL